MTALVSPALSVPILARVRGALSRVLEGKEEIIERVLVGVLAGGHVLLEDSPGVGKTTLAKAVARSFEIDFARVQFTPDLLPSDITGSQVLNPRDGSLSFHQGPVFTHVLLADEINRASPRTQSALLEAMNEAQVTVDGVTRPLPDPFFVLATQNPSDASGTFPLPEAQLDRFLLRTTIGYPSPDAELRMLFSHQEKPPVDAVESVATRDDLVELQAKVRRILVKEDVARYMLRIVAATRLAPELAQGVSPRGALALFRASQAQALLAGRSYVSPLDVKGLVGPVLAHRVRPTEEARYAGKSDEAVVAEIAASIDVPT